MHSARDLMSGLLLLIVLGLASCLNRLLGASNEEVWPRVSKITSWHEYLYGAQMAMSIPRHLKKWLRKMMAGILVKAFIHSSISTTFNQSLNATYGKVSNSSHFHRCIPDRPLWTRWSLLINVRMYSFWVPHLISVDRLVVLLTMHNGRALWNSKAYQRK